MVFRVFVVAWLSATILFYELPQLPDKSLIIALSLGVVSFVGRFIWRCQRTRICQIQVNRFIVALLLGFIIGICWLYWQAFFAPKMERQQFDRPVLIQAQVTQLPVWQANDRSARKKLKLVLQIEQLVNLDSERDKNWVSHKFATDWPNMGRPTAELSWYLDQDDRPEMFGLMDWPQLGETFWLSAKLKQPRGQSNPGGFEYERYLFAKGVHARGYVKKLSKRQFQQVTQWMANRLPTFTHGGKASRVVIWRSDRAASVLDRFRTTLYQKLTVAFASSQYLPIVQALTLGERSGVVAEDWALFKTTGTIHLMAISGLHIGIAALVGYGLFWGLWKLLLFRWQVVELWFFAKLGALFFATLYAYLSGFSVSTERAWIMVVIAGAFLFAQRPVSLWSSYFLALWLVILWQPTSVLLQGFWLSFLAVAWIFISLPVIKNKPRWQQFLILQAVLSVGLLPALLYFFAAIPTYSFLANLLALPLISLLVMPVLFVLVLGLAFLPNAAVSWLAQWLWPIDGVFDGLWRWLQWIEQLPASLILVPPLSGLSVVLIYALGFGVMGWFLRRRPLELAMTTRGQSHRSLESWRRYCSRVALLQPQNGLSINKATTIYERWWASRWLRSVMLVVLATGLIASLWRDWGVARPNPAQFYLTVLDVGQGSAMVIETQNHTLLYDLGAYWGEKIDGSKMAVLPYLQMRSIKKVDQLLVSHSDNDHAGGLKSLLARMSVAQALSGQAAIMNQRVEQAIFQQCQQGQSWQWDGVAFEILAPRSEWLAQSRLSDNDHSCVLQVSTGRYKVMITGDLSTDYEQKLLHSIEDNSARRHALASQILIAGHHGSQYSSGSAWLRAIQPKIVLVSAGYQNRFGFPHSAFLQRLQTPKTQVFNTACSGAIRWSVSPDGLEKLNLSRHEQTKWYYQPCNPDEFRK